MKPILFNTEMVRAIQNGTKTVTRRLIKHPYYIDKEDVCRKSGLAMHVGINATHGMPYPDNPYDVGDILYVRETWRYVYDLDEHEDLIEESGRYIYYADNPNPFSVWIMPDGTKRDSMPWKPSIHMPKEAARIFLRATDVRVEQVQEITELDILEKEGVTVDFPQPKPTYISLAYTETKLKPAVKKAFADLWNSTVKKSDLDKYGWDANPWVWVIEFERTSKEEAYRT